MRNPTILTVFSFGAALLLTAFAATPSVAELKPIRALLICGGCCHDYDNQKSILAEGLKARAHIEVDTIQQGGSTTDSKIAVYENPDWANEYDIIIHDECFSDVKDPNWTAGILKPHKEGLPAVVLHCAMHSYRDGTDEWFKFLGVTSRGHGAHYPHEVLTREGKHPIMQTLGAGWWNPAGELYNIEKLWPTAQPLASAKNQENGKEEVCVWVNNYHNGTRVFGTTLGHHNETVSLPAYLDLLTRGTLWAAGKLNDTYLKKPPGQLVPENLARDKKATASSTQQGHPTDHAFDASSATRWCADGAQLNEWLQVDLGSNQEIHGTNLDWESTGAIYKYKIEGSQDGSDWKLLVDATANERKGVCEDRFDTSVRHLRITFLGSSTGSWGSINEVQVFGPKMISLDPTDLLRDREKSILTEVKIPEGFEATVFATPPAVNYPVFVAAAPDGTLFVSSDKNGSLDRGPRRGRVLRARDLDHDGRADEVKMFVSDVDSPRGLVWDHDRLYLLHPPHLSAFIDHNGDGISDEQKILVKNIAFGFKDRPADHSSNGIELGIDGWIYCAIGDFGFMEAEGTDGRKLQLRGGGVVRVRPDGTGLELYSRGTRNILEVAVSPLLDLFARDNTNDGDGWDVRFHHFSPLSEHGYPSLYKNFKGEFIEPLADYGGGSGCGAMFLSEPGFPDGYNNAPYTADWGREWVYRHQLTPNGATFKANQDEFVRAPRVTDLDVDASSHIYVSSWKGASFTYVGEDVGYVVRVSPKGYKPEPLPDFATMSDSALVAALESPSQRRRLAAQRALVRNNPNAETIGALEKVAANKEKTLATRIAALFALKQARGSDSHPFLVKLAGDNSITEYAVRALADRLDQLQNVAPEPILKALTHPDPRVRREASFALARLGHQDHALAITPLLSDSDPIVVHTAMQTLRKLEAHQASFAVLDDPAVPSTRRIGALRVLQALHKPAVVDGLVTRLHRETNPAHRKSLITTLCRLHFRDAEWKGDSWGTRPDTSGPYYQQAEWSETSRINSFLEDLLAQAPSPEAAHILTELGRHKIQSPQLLKTVVTLATKHQELLPAALAQLAQAKSIPEDATPLLSRVALDPQSSAELQSQAIVALTKLGTRESTITLLQSISKLNRGEEDRPAFRQARQAFLNSPHHEKQLELFEAEAAKLNSQTSPWADAVLLVQAEKKNGSQEARSAASKALESGWAQASRQAQILTAVALAEHRPYKDKVLAAVYNSNPSIAEAALLAARALKIENEIQKSKTPSEPVIADLQVSQVLAAVLKTKGDIRLGAEIFNRQTCSSCHTVSEEEPLRGPFLGTIATTYKREDLVDAILVPNKSVAQGFATHQFVLKDGTEHEGFVIQEAADKVIIRNVAAQEIQIAVPEIETRRKSEKSLMPEGLAANLTIRELASLIDYLQSLPKN